MDIIRPEALVGDTVYYTNGVDAKVEQLKLPSLELQSISLKPMNVVQTMPTADPDKLLVLLSSGEYGQDWFQYSLSSGQVARLQARDLGRMRYITTLKANAWVEGTRLVITKNIPAVGVEMSPFGAAPMLESESRPDFNRGAYPTPGDSYPQAPSTPSQYR